MANIFHKRLSGFLFLFLSKILLFAQGPQMNISFTQEAIQVDGILDEVAWQNAPATSNFQQHFPNNGAIADQQTEVKMLFDQRFLYIAAYCKQNSEQSFVVQSLKRDFELSENDAFEIYLDAFSDANSGLVFGVNPFGVQRDGIIPNGGIKGIDLTWDGQWFAEVTKQADGWLVEMAIPFKTLRFNQAQKSWKVNFSRSTVRQNELSTWAPIPRGFPLSTLALMGTLNWANAPPAFQHNIALIPYLATKAEKEGNADRSTNPLSGLDMKVGVSSSLNLDLTINPDFSQVEVDQQVIDLNRFELFFPEKRLFFLENSDLFNNLGNSRIHPFFSRRIGSLNNEPVPILYGGRLSGKIGKDWKIGLMNMQSKEKKEEQMSAQNYLVATLQKSIFSGSSLTGFLTNRQSVDGLHFDADDFSKIAGFEFDYRSKDSKLTGKSFLHYSLSPGAPKDAFAYSAKARYRTKEFSLFMGLDGVGKNYIPDMGYVPRLYHDNEAKDTSIRISYIESRTNGYYRYFLKNNPEIDFVGTELRMKLYTDQNFKYQEHQFDWNLHLAFVNKNSLTLSFSDYSQILFFPFTLDGLDQAFQEGIYPNQKFSIEFDTGKRQALYGKAKVAYSGEFMGGKFSLNGAANYRYHQHLVLGFTFSYQELRDFPSTYGDAYFTLLGSQLELSFSRNLFFTTFLQYNTQAQNINVNSRFNWRFHPLSDLYIVYTSNYYSEDLSKRNNALVLKINYWLNL